MRSRSVEGQRTSWIGWLLEWIPTRSRCLVPAVVVTLIVYGIGLVPALVEGFALRYVQTEQIMVLAVAIGWVLGWGAWSTDALGALPEEIRPALRDPNAEAYERLKASWYRRVFATWPNAVIGGVWFLLAFGVVWSGSAWLDWFPESWDVTGSELRAERTILTVYFAVASPLFITMIWGFIFYVDFTWRALTFPLEKMPNLARTYLRPITRFGLRTGLGWSVAVTLTVAFFARELSGTVVAFLTTLGVMGAALIVLPQVLAHIALTRMRDEVMLEVAEEIRAEKRAAVRGTSAMLADPRIRERWTLLGDLHRTPVWIYSPSQVVTFVAQVLLPIATFVFASE